LTETLSATEMLQALDRFPAANVLVIGDIILDHFLWGSVSRISPEAPVPVVNVTRESLMLGGAANVLHNLYGLGARATLCGVIGDDVAGDQLLSLLGDLSSPTAGVVKVANRTTTKKTRVIAHSQQVVRVDREVCQEPPAETVDRILAFIDGQIDRFDAIIVSDYAKGLITVPFMERLRRCLASHRSLPLIVDPKPGRSQCYRGVTVITPNNTEAEQMSGIAIRDEASLLAAATKLLDELACQAMLITRGEHGMALLERGQPLLTIPTRAKEVFDVTGAGDTVIATLALGLAIGLSFGKAATIANAAAGIVVGKVGTATVSIPELREALT